MLRREAQSQGLPANENPYMVAGFNDKGMQMANRDILEQRRMKREKERKKLQLAVNRHLPLILQGLFILIEDKERRVEICRTSSTAAEALRMIATAIEEIDFETVSKTPGEFFGLLMDIASKVLRNDAYEKTPLETPSAVLLWFAGWLESEMDGVKFE